MAFALSDRVKETTTTTGTGDITLGGAATGYQTFNSGVGVGNTAYYCIAGQGTSEWEVGFGTLSASTTLARTKIFASSNAGSAVNFSAGTKDVFVTFPASAGYSGASGQVFTASGTFTIPTGITRVKVTVIGGGGGGSGGGESGCVNYPGGSGGGGGTAIKWLTDLTPTNTLSVTRGAGGAGGAQTTNGTSGGTSSVASGTQSITTVSATGGSGGSYPISSLGGVGGAGGAGSNGDINSSGGGGGYGGGAGGSSSLGGGGSTPGSAGGLYGGGGGGGSPTGGGGSGANGVIIFEW